MAKHASSAQARITVNGDGGSITMTIADDGPSFDAARTTGGGQVGLEIMRERALEVDAAFDIETAPGLGTRLNVRWPSGSEEPPPGGRH